MIRGEERGEMTLMTEQQRVPFRLLAMPCCGQRLCWVNPRFPSYCPECGKYVFGEIKSCVTFKDEKAILKYELEDS